MAVMARDDLRPQVLGEVLVPGPHVHTVRSEYMAAPACGPAIARFFSDSG